MNKLLAHGKEHFIQIYREDKPLGGSFDQLLLWWAATSQFGSDPWHEISRPKRG